MNIELLIVCLLSLLAGYAIGTNRRKNRLVGELQLINSDEANEKPYMFMALSRDVSFILRQKYVMLKVNSKIINPQK